MHYPRNQKFSSNMGEIRFSYRKQDIMVKNADQPSEFSLQWTLKVALISGIVSALWHQTLLARLNQHISEKGIRNRGIGTTLMVHAISWMKEQSGTDMRVHVTVGNEDVMQFYEKVGLYPWQYILSNTEEL